MNKKYILVEVPGDWKPARCTDCPIPCKYAQRVPFPRTEKCPLANAKEAVEVYQEEDRIVGSCYHQTKVNGKLVKLWATREDK